MLLYHKLSTAVEFAQTCKPRFTQGCHVVAVCLCVVCSVKTCCGFVYRGRYGECLIDAGLYHRCDSHGNHRHGNYLVSTATVAESSSVDSGNDNDDDDDEDEDDDDDISPASSSYLADDAEDDRLSSDDITA